MENCKKDISAEELAKNVRIGDIVSVAKIGSNGKVLSYYHNIVCTSRFTNSNETDAVFFHHIQKIIRLSLWRQLCVITVETWHLE